MHVRAERGKKQSRVEAGPALGISDQHSRWLR
jgi:hypothetical protein